jgi:hypothetical protein
VQGQHEGGSTERLEEVSPVHPIASQSTLDEDVGEMLPGLAGHRKPITVFRFVAAFHERGRVFAPEVVVPRGRLHSVMHGVKGHRGCEGRSGDGVELDGNSTAGVGPVAE